MSITAKCIGIFFGGFIISLLLMTRTYATTEFYISPDDEKIIKCEYLKILENQVLCTQDNLLSTYALSQIKKVEVIQEGRSQQIQRFTEGAITKINNFNLNKTTEPTAPKQENKEPEKFSTLLLDFAQQLSFASFHDFIKTFKIQFSRFAEKSILAFPGFIQSLETQLKHFKKINTATKTLFISGVIIFFLGCCGFIIATFRAGIFWGISCMLLPFVSFIFLFVHWKAAYKPFLTTILGIALFILGTQVDTLSRFVFHVTNFKHTTQEHTKTTEQYACNGKIYCSQMTSCAEAKFYLQNCPGTQIDGNNDGVPCEKQWCGK